MIISIFTSKINIFPQIPKENRFDKNINPTYILHYTEKPRRFKQKRHSIRPAPLRNRGSKATTTLQQKRASTFHNDHQHRIQFDQVVQEMNSPITQIQIARNSFKRNSKKSRNRKKSRSKSPMTPLRNTTSNTNSKKRPSSAKHKREYTPSNSNLLISPSNPGVADIVTFSDAIVSHYHNNTNTNTEPVLGIIPSEPHSNLQQTQSYGSPINSHTG